MQVLVTGATGFVGRALIPRLQREGHSIVVWARSGQRARNLLGADVGIIRADDDDSLDRAVSGCDAIVNLAGESIVGRRWTAARRALLEQSRVDVTHRLVRAMQRASSRPHVLISASAVGWYGNRGDEVLTEESGPGDDFLSNLCRHWEAAANAAQALGVRVVTLRTGVVLGRDGGALARMLPPFRMGVGGPIGSGRQFMPWIHLHDLVKIVAVALLDPRYVGPVNGVAPHQVTSRTFAAALGGALRRPAILPVPAPVLRVAFGKAAVVLLGSQRVEPRTLSGLAFTWDFPNLDRALEDITGGVPVTIGLARSGGQAPDSAYELRMATQIDTPLEKAFSFFSKAENLGLLTPASMKFAIRGEVPTVGEDAIIDYRVRVGPWPINWRTRIVAWQPGRRFVDVQAAGPYRFWWHEHRFRSDGSRTVMEDRVRYTPPLGALGRIVHRVFIAPTLRHIFRHRDDVIRLRFGGGRERIARDGHPADAA